MSRYGLAVGIALALAGFAGCFLLEGKSSQEEVAQLRAEIAQLKKKQEQQEAKLRTPAPARTVIVERTVPAESAPTAPDEDSPTESREQPAEPPQKEDRYRRLSDEEIEEDMRRDAARLIKKFEHQPVDPLWAPDFEELIRNAIVRAVPPGGSLERVECRTKLCVIQLRYPAGYDGGDAILGPLDAVLDRKRGGLLNLHFESTPLEHTIFVARLGARDAYDDMVQQ